MRLSPANDTMRIGIGAPVGNCIGGGVGLCAADEKNGAFQTHPLLRQSFRRSLTFDGAYALNAIV